SAEDRPPFEEGDEGRPEGDRDDEVPYCKERVAMTFTVGLYENEPAAYHAYDPGAADVAQLVIQAIAAAEPRVTAEHIGSTAMPGCAGKGAVDLMVLSPAGLLEAAKGALNRLGFQRQGTRDPFPEDRPMRLGAVEHGGKVYRLHAHVLAADAEEAMTLR